MLLVLAYVLGLWLLWRTMRWDSKNRTWFSFGTLLLLACTLAVIGPVVILVSALNSLQP